jgi:hypothetical protein
MSEGAEMPKARALRLSDDFEDFIAKTLPAAQFRDAWYEATQLLRRLRRLEAHYEQQRDANEEKREQLRRQAQGQRRDRSEDLA